MSWYRSFTEIEWLFLILLLVSTVLYVIRLYKIHKIFPVVYSGVIFKQVLRLLIFALLLLAWLGPSSGFARREVKAIGKDIFFCIDLSKSMDAIDVPPTRIERTKNELKRIIRTLATNRMGIIIFSSEAFMQCPLTFDQSALLMLTDAMNTNLVPSGGTDLAPPLRMAMNKLSEENQSASRVTSKIIVLISDGEDFGEETGEVARELEQKGFKLFTLGVGTEKGGPIQTSSGFKTDREGNQVITRLNAEGLKELASRTGGNYFELSDQRNDINRLVASINAIEGELMDARLIDVTANQYPFLLTIALFLLILDILIPVNILRLS
ncbi:MAG: VWA domain-containing protein [Cyclobacteriaceae bacterium]|nr:VWA domain-containing protein [Cyclobacteriaceae bacterium]